MIRIFLAAALLVSPCAVASAQVPPDALKELAPTGKLRAAINYGNGVLAQNGPDGEPRGVSADLSRELAKRLGVPLEFATFEAAGKAFEAAKENKIDVLFVAIEPVRAAVFPLGTPIAIEAPCGAYSQLPPRERAKQVMAATRRLLSTIQV